MNDYVVWLRHRTQATMRQVTVRATSHYEASRLATANNFEHTIARVYPIIAEDDD